MPNVSQGSLTPIALRQACLVKLIIGAVFQKQIDPHPPTFVEDPSSVYDRLAIPAEFSVEFSGKFSVEVLASFLVCVCSLGRSLARSPRSSLDSMVLLHATW